MEDHRGLLERLAGVEGKRKGIWSLHPTEAPGVAPRLILAITLVVGSELGEQTLGRVLYVQV